MITTTISIIITTTNIFVRSRGAEEQVANDHRSCRGQIIRSKAHSTTNLRTKPNKIKSKLAGLEVTELKCKAKRE